MARSVDPAAPRSVTPAGKLAARVLPDLRARSSGSGMHGHDDRWLYANGQTLRGGEQAPGATAMAPQRTLDALYPPSMASSLLLNTNFAADAASDALRGQALPSPHRLDGAPAEPQSPTQMLLGLLGLLPNSTGPSPRVRQPSTEGQNLDSMLNLLAQDGQQPGSLHSLLAHHGNATTGLTPREEMTNHIFDCARRLPCAPLYALRRAKLTR